MTLTIELPDEQTQALTAKAMARGISAERYARQALEHRGTGLQILAGGRGIETAHG
jgi:predicted transcriptional regulator